MFPRHCKKDEDHKAHIFWSPSGLRVTYLCRGGAWSEVNPTSCGVVIELPQGFKSAA